MNGTDIGLARKTMSSVIGCWICRQLAVLEHHEKKTFWCDEPGPSKIVTSESRVTM